MPTSKPPTRRGRVRFHALGVALCALAIAACGSSSKPSGPLKSASSGASAALRYSECMRANGVPNFPDPNAQGEIPGDFNLQSPQVQAAQNKCRKFGHRPLSRAQQQALKAGTLVYSVCMRAHGVPDFPDPQTVAGGVVIGKVDNTPGSALNPYSPAFQKASKACQGDLRRASRAAGLPPPPGANG